MGVGGELKTKTNLSQARARASLLRLSLAIILYHAISHHFIQVKERENNPVNLTKKSDDV